VKLIALALLGLLFCSGCGTSYETTASEGFRATVSIPPQKYFLKRVTGDLFDIKVMIPPGHSPATYAPTPRQMRFLNRSKIYFSIGHLPFEKAWMTRIMASNKEMRVVDTSRGISLIREDHHHHGKEDGSADHGPDSSGINPHIWLSPQAVKIQARNMLKGVLAIDPKNRQIYENNFRRFIEDVGRLIVENELRFTGLSNRTFMVFHPAWSYFAREYQLTQLAIEWAGKVPNPAHLVEYIETAKTKGIDVILVQRQFDTHSAEAIASEIGGRVIELDPLAEDWLANMRTIATTISQILDKRQ
jgi:zinc transport system substrate-binding protein